MSSTILLRRWQSADIAPLVLLANNKKIWDQLRDFFPHPYTRAHASKWITAHAGKSTSHFAIEYNGKLAGAISIIPKEDIYRYSAELGYWIGEPFWGKGIATDAVKQGLVILKKEYPSIIRVYAEIFAENKASIRVVEKNGFYLESIRRNAVVKNRVPGDDTVWVKLIQGTGN